MKNLFIILTLLIGTNAYAGHTHGEGKLAIAVEGKSLTITIDLPMEAAVGFERAPRNDAEKSALAHAERTLADATLFRPSPAAQCKAGPVKVSMPKAGHTGHADIQASYRYECAQPEVLNEITTPIFTQFKRLYRIDGQRIGPKGQGSVRLTPKKPMLSLQ
jgi:hypothetical protein